MELQPNNINWDMVQAIIGIMSFVMAVIGAAIVLVTRWIFITKKEFQTFSKENSKEISSKLYDKGITIFMPREECEKCMTEVKKVTSSIVPREEWEKSKAYRERRIDENQRVVCGKIDEITASIKDMNKAHEKTNKSLNNMMGSFKTYLELKGHNDIQG